jgi:cyclophilin family peptidyl-prolyl cis-trans isomerase
MSRLKIVFVILGIILITALLILGIIFALSDRETRTFTPGASAEKATNIETTVPAPTPIVPAVINPEIKSDSSIKNNTMPIVKITTNKGEITIELFADDAPKTVDNFVTLAKKGFYNGVIFHRVISGFMIQGGDPTGTGAGGPGYKFADELNPATPSFKAGYLRGTVAMANSGPNTNGSQFFIMHKDYPLPHSYSIFGKVTAGLEVIDAIAASRTDGSDRPLEKIVMEKVEVVE